MGLLKKSVYFAFIACGVYLLKRYMNGPLCESKARLDGKVVIVTGGNTGIGKETVKGLALRGAKVYLACRSLVKAQDAVKDIQKETGINADRLPIIRLDLASLKSVREFVREFNKKEKTLDILINNAGAAFSDHRKTEDGFESTMAVNHLGHFLLTHLLMDALTSAPRSRIINVSGLIYQYVEMNLDDIMCEKNYNMLYCYCQGKFANVLFTRELAKRLKGSGITSYALHPGVINTELGRELPLMDTTIGNKFWQFLSWPFLKDLWHGAQTTICCAVDENLANSSGKYYSDCQEIEVTKEAQDDETCRKFWDISIELVKLDPSEIHRLLK